MHAYQVASVTSDSLQPYGPQPERLPHPWDSPGKNTGVGCRPFLQGILLTQRLNLSPALAGEFFTTSHQGAWCYMRMNSKYRHILYTCQHAQCVLCTDLGSKRILVSKLCHTGSFMFQCIQISGEAGTQIGNCILHSKPELHHCVYKVWLLIVGAGPWKYQFFLHRLLRHPSRIEYFSYFYSG